VLLLLYLALDDHDDRPLIIDQPEENLDPKSVFDELVSLFITAKSKRQVIMVTHNANLVINTDADQIIIAEAGPHPTGGLPPISYMAGGLEDAQIREAVCNILEGGEEAFRERARRLRGTARTIVMRRASLDPQFRQLKNEARVMCSTSPAGWEGAVI
jgi:energy-coupling factor transporter ATP-binding protein EcfA2